MQVSPRDAHWLLTEKYHGEKTEDYHKDLNRLALGEPIAYVIGWIPFLKAHIKLDGRPLIPRPETEFWANEAFRMIEKEHGHMYHYALADVYSGSGCIGIGALMHFPKAHGTFIDIGSDECKQIEENIRINVLHKERASVLQGDACALLVGPYDAIFANPPYIPKEADNVDESVKQWEPYRALYAGHDGLAEIKKLLSIAPFHLTPQGTLFCEFGLHQELDIATLREAANWNINFYKDQYGVTRWFQAKLK